MTGPSSFGGVAPCGPGDVNLHAIHAWYLGFTKRVMTDPGLAPLRPLFAVDATILGDFHAVCRHQVKVMDTVARSQNVELLSGIVAAMDAYSRQDWGAELLEDAEQQGMAAEVANLARDGYVRLPPVDGATAAAMRTYFDDKDVFDDSRLIPCGMNETQSWHRAQFPTTTVFSCPGLVALANDQKLLSLVAGHLGAVPTILGYSAWWSFAGRETPFEEQYFHRDLADYRFCKLFLYLTDVDADSGPHAFVPGTHDPAAMAARAADWPAGRQDFFDWFFRSLRKTDVEARKYLGIDPDLIAGPAGTLFLADTRGIHKGLMPRLHDRLVCQVVYGVSANMQRPRDVSHPFPVPVGTGLAASVPAAVAAPPLAYINRFYVAPGRVL